MNPQQPFIVRDISTVRLPRYRGVSDQDLEVSWSYTNNTSRSILLRDRWGQSFQLPCKPKSLQTGELSAYRKVKATESVLIEYIEWLQSNKMVNSTERDRMVDACHMSLLEHRNIVARRPGVASKRIEFTVEYVIKEDVLLEPPSAVYFEELDLLIASSFRCTIKHPNCQEVRERFTYGDLLPNIGKDSLILTMKLVDNKRHRTMSSRYINFAGEIFEVPAVKDPTLAEGFHLQRREAVDPNRINRGTVEKIRMTITEAEEKFGLKKTVEEATWGGPINEVSKLHIEEIVARMKLDDTLARDQLRKVERVHEDKLKVSDTRITELKTTAAELKADTELRQERLKLRTQTYERSAHWLNTISGTIKTVAGVAITLVAIWQQVRSVAGK